MPSKPAESDRPIAEPHPAMDIGAARRADGERDSRSAIRLLPWLLIVIGLIVYQSSLGGQFILDSVLLIPQNPRIAQLWPPDYLTRNTRPVLELTFALNYAVAGVEPVGYHAVNMLIHIAAALTLFGLVRRTLLLPSFGHRHDSAAPWLAFAIAMLWLVHPLNTQAVTYVVQRSESLMGLFYLLTLYGVLRAVSVRDATAGGDAGSATVGDENGDKLDAIVAHRRELLWLIIAALCFALALGCKAVAVTAPALVLLYDWTFLRGGLVRVLRRHWVMVAAGAVVALTALAYVTDLGAALLRRGSAGLGVDTVTPMGYLASQAGVILHYLRLAFWPQPLILDYIWPPVTSYSQALVPGAVIVALLLLTLWALWRRHVAGFLGAWFFLILSPTSSFVPLYDLAVEHRMYLSLIAVLALAVGAGYRGLEKLRRAGVCTQRSRAIMTTVALLAVASALAARTIARNHDYHDPFGMWEQVIHYRPDNLRAHSNYGFMLLTIGRLEEGERHLRQALESRNPQFLVDVRTNLGKALVMRGRADEALAHLAAARQTEPRNPRIEQYTGDAYVELGDGVKAIEHYRLAVEYAPRDADMQFFLGWALLRFGHADEAVVPLAAAFALSPRSPSIAALYALAWARSGRAQSNEAFEMREHAGDDAQALAVVAEVALLMGDRETAMRCVEQALAMDAELPDALSLRAWLLINRQPRTPAAIDEARRSATRACELTAHQSVRGLEALAASYAAGAQYDRAVDAMQRAIERATALGLTHLLPAMNDRLARYRQNEPLPLDAPLLPAP